LQAKVYPRIDLIKRPPGAAIKSHRQGNGDNKYFHLRLTKHRGIALARFHSPFYNVSGKVGPSSAEFRNDVLLVQYFLFFIMIGSSATWPGGFSQFGVTAPAGAGPDALFPFTGKFTPGLSVWIRHFQITANARGFGPLTVDGAVNRARTSWGLPVVANPGFFTIQSMNHIMWLKNTRAFNNLAAESDLPPELKKDFTLVSFN
jgi:hypothetical protein